MKKTVSINLKGINFIIEEDAYELLQDYLDRLERTLNNQEGAKEIIEDVELRIAEICSSKLNDQKTVIELADIQEILARLGDPSDYVEVDEDETGRSTYDSANTGNQHKERRLFRDTENAAIAGVCQGIANFFSIDVVIIRALFVVFFLFAGFGFPLYIILWIIVPSAKNTIDRLRMKGKPITVENVREEVETAAERLKSSSTRFSKSFSGEGIRESASTGVRIISSIVGVGFIAWGIFMLILFLIFIVGGFRIFPVHSDNGFLSFPELGELVLASPSDVTWAWYAALMIGFGATLFSILLGTSLLMRIKNKWVKINLLVLFLVTIAGGILAFYLGIKTARDFAYDGEIEQEIGSVQTTQLTVIPELNQLQTVDGYTVKSDGEYGLMDIDKYNITFHSIDIQYRPSSDSTFHIYQNLSARSHSRKRGLERAMNIRHEIGLTGDSLIMATDYKCPVQDKIRDQEVTIIIEVPKNGSVKIGNREIRLGSDSIKEKESDRVLFERGKLYGDGDYSHYD